MNVRISNAFLVFAVLLSGQTGQKSTAQDYTNNERNNAA